MQAAARCSRYCLYCKIHRAIPGLRLGDITAEAVALPTQTAKYDLSLNIQETANGLRCIMEYNTDLYEEETIGRMAGHFGKLLVSVSGSQDDKVSDLSMLDATEQRLLEKFNDTAAIYPKESNIVNLFEAQVSTTPNVTAIIVDGETISYKELNERANQLARYLQRAGVTAETLVPVCMERDIAMLVSILAVLKAGGAYVPVDMDYPAARISYMLTDTAAQVVLCSKNSKNKLSDSLNRQTLIVIDGEQQAAISAESSSAIETAIKPDQLAYVIYTSGSTGTPKGVMVEHGNANAFIAWCISEFAGYDIDTVYASTSVCFDLSVFEMFYTLSTGKTIRLLTNGLAIKNYLPVDKNVLINTVPSVMESLLAEGVDFSNATVINMAGEPVPLHVLKGLDTDNIAVRNLYGPTEDTTYSTCYVLDKNLPVLIGKPIANSRAYIITQDNKEINPVGVPGEICIGGAGVTRGYLNKPELTNEKFIKDIYSSEPDARMYKTGDIGRWLPNGNIEYLGRKDDQVKVRGYRIELGEIENALAESGLIKQAVVLAREDKNGNKRLVAYITTTGVYNKEALQQHLGQHLPEYMVPRLWVQLENFPLTTNGKIDKRALPDAELAGETEGYVEPRNPVELKLAEIWQELLGIEKVGIYDNFFELGGDSILTIQVVSRARKAGIEIQPKDIFIHQAIANLADSIQNAEAGNIKTEQGLLSGEVGLLPIQQWYLQKDEEQISHYNQSILFKIDKSIKADDLQNCIDVLTVHHDALRLKYAKVNNQWQQEYGTEQPKLITEYLTGISQENLATIIGECAQKHQRSLSITDGKLMRVVLMDTPDHETANRLYIVVHHLAIDGVSWRIILEDLNNLLDGMMTGLQLDMGPKSSSYRQWQLALKQYSTSRKLQLQEKYWEQIAADYQPLPQDTSYQGNVTVEDMISFKVKLDATRTQQLLQDIPKVYHTEINDMLLAALGDTLCKWTGKDKVVIGLEGHGREQISNDIDISRTVGWFTSLYPVLLTSAINDDMLIKQVKESLRKIEDKGIGFGVLKYMNKSVNLQGADSWDLIFNYLGQLNTTANPGKWLSRADEDSGASVSEKQTSPSKIAINSYVVDGQLIMHWSYSGIHFNAATINNIAGQYLTCLTQLIDHCLEEGRSRVIFTPADYGLSAEVNYEELDKFLGEDNNDNIMSF
jgi:amino acid adenylation domain-containing protein/non-ribosomal peptide synthase protein (TIGR01720 family)